MLSKKSSAHLLVFTVATGAVLLSLRWFESKVGTGGFFSGVVIGVVLIVVRSWRSSHPCDARSRRSAQSVPVFALVDDQMPRMFDSEFIPATYIIAADSRIAFKHEGAAAWDHPRVVAYLRGLLVEADILAMKEQPS